jgi:hypothetical protein
MAFRVTSAPHKVWQEVTLSYLAENGAVTTSKVELQFELLDDAAVADGLGAEGGLVGGTAEDRERGVAFMRRVTHDWKGFEDEAGQALPFDSEQLGRLLLFPWFAEPITRAYFAARRGRRAGN